MQNATANAVRGSARVSRTSDGCLTTALESKRARRAAEREAAKCCDEQTLEGLRIQRLQSELQRRNVDTQNCRLKIDYIHLLRPLLVAERMAGEWQRQMNAQDHSLADHTPARFGPDSQRGPTTQHVRSAAIVVHTPVRSHCRWSSLLSPLVRLVADALELSSVAAWAVSCRSLSKVISLRLKGAPSAYLSVRKHLFLCSAPCRLIYLIGLRCTSLERVRLQGCDLDRASLTNLLKNNAQTLHRLELSSGVYGLVVRQALSDNGAQLRTLVFDRVHWSREGRCRATLPAVTSLELCSSEMHFGHTHGSWSNFAFSHLPNLGHLTLVIVANSCDYSRLQLQWTRIMLETEARPPSMVDLVLGRATYDELKSWCRAEIQRLSAIVQQRSIVLNWLVRD